VGRKLGDLAEIYKNKKDLGRANARKKQREVSVVERSAEDASKVPSSPWKRGVAMKDRIAAVAVAQNHDSAEQRNLEFKVATVNKKIQALQILVQLRTSRLEFVTDTRQALTSLTELDNKIQDALAELEALQATRLGHLQPIDCSLDVICGGERPRSPGGEHCSASSFIEHSV
jgi:hypothetical protein